MHESLVPALRMGTIGPLNRWVGSSAVVLANPAAVAKNCPQSSMVYHAKKY